MGGKTGTAILIEIKENPQRSTQTVLARTALVRPDLPLEELVIVSDILL
jgi:hypothetical protein